MRLVLQRVTRGSVTVNGEVVGALYEDTSHQNRPIDERNHYQDG